MSATARSAGVGYLNRYSSGYFLQPQQLNGGRHAVSEVAVAMNTSGAAIVGYIGTASQAMAQRFDNSAIPIGSPVGS